MPIPMQCECGHFWEASERSVGLPVACVGCGATLTVGRTAQAPGPAGPPMTPYGYALTNTEPPPPRGMAITGGILALLAGLGHAFIGFMLLVLATFLSAFIHALVGDSAAGAAAKNEAYGIMLFLLVYTGLSTLSCVPAILATLGRYWAVLASAIFQALLLVGLVYLTVRSEEWIVGVAAAFSGMALVFCLLGLREARAHGEYLRLQREGPPVAPPGY